MTTFYVYAYLRIDGTPYYIGKGIGRRAYEQHRRNGKGIYTPKDRSKIVFLETKLTEIGAFALERRMIQWYGRQDNSTGILKNKTDGGEGVAGFIISENTKQKMSAAKKGRKFSEEHKRNMSIAHIGKKIPAETIKKMASSMTGKIASESTKAKISNAIKLWHKNRKEQKSIGEGK